jgi:Predicted transcriptional regulators
MSRKRVGIPEYDTQGVQPNVKRLKQLRREADLPAQRIATYLGVTVAHVSAMEKGKTKIFVEHLKALSLFYRKPLDYFFLPDDP